MKKEKNKKVISIPSIHVLFNDGWDVEKDRELFMIPSIQELQVGIMNLFSIHAWLSGG